MRILVTGAKGMVGTALCNNLKNIRDGKNKTRSNIHIEEIYEYDLGDEDKLDGYCKDCEHNKCRDCQEFSCDWCKYKGLRGEEHEID